MNTLLILLAQTKSAATIEILSLLLVAAIIGYVTAWLYYKSIYEKRIKAVESEKDELKNQLDKLDTDNGICIKVFMKRISKLRILMRRLMRLKLFTQTTLLNEEDEALVHIAQRKHLLDYKSFGTATEAEKDDLKMISGIGPFIEERLHAS